MFKQSAGLQSLLKEVRGCGLSLWAIGVQTLHRAGGSHSQEH